jgi:integrase
MLNRIVGEAELGSVGLIDPLDEFRGRPLADYLEEHVNWLRSQGRTEHHCGKVRTHVLKVCDGCGFTGIDDLDPDEAAEYLAGLRVAGEVPQPDPEREWYSTFEAAPLVGIAAASLRHLAAVGPLPGPAPRRGDYRRMVFLHRDTVAQLMARRSRGTAVATTNQYVGSLRHFSRWLAQKINRALENRKKKGTPRQRWADPLADLKRLNAKVDVRHQRRPIVPEDFDRFLAATRANRTLRGLTGEDRAMLYTVAIYTGLRASELASLTPASFDLDAEPPTVTVEAGYSKHRREDVQVLRRDVAELLRPYLAGRPRLSRVWPGRWRHEGAVLLRRDLSAAGIPYEDERGKVIDFHGLRHTFISALARAGVRPKAAQELARHSTSKLTLDYYTHVQLLDHVGALNTLPPPPAPEVGGVKHGPQEERRRA